MPVDPFFATSNYIEAGLWITIGVVFGLTGIVAGRENRGRCLLASVTFALFGLSDIVEAHTGAWWRPWWLFAWKAAGVGVFLWLLVDHLRRRRARRRRAAPDG